MLAIVDDPAGSAATKKITVDNVSNFVAADTQTFTNKTFDANGTGNSLSNVDLTADITGTLPVANGGTGVTTKTGTGNAVLSTSPTFVTPLLGTPTSGVATNLTGTAAGLTAGAVSTITGLAPDTATTQATQPSITTMAAMPWTGMKVGTDGEVPTFDASGNPAFVAVGTATHVLTSNGVGAAPTFQAAAGGGQTLYGAIVATSGGDYTSLNAALAGGETRIFVRNGTYAETGEEEIASNTIIMGESREGVVIDVDGTTNKRILLGNGSNVTKVQIQNLTLKSTTATNHILDSANVAGSGIGDLLIRNVTFDGGGMHLAASSGSTVSGDLEVDACHFKTFSSASSAIYTRGTTGTFDMVKVTNCTTDSNTSNPDFISIAVNGGDASRVIVKDNNVVCANLVTGNVKGSDSNGMISISGNTIEGTSICGLTVEVTYSGIMQVHHNSYVHDNGSTTTINLQDNAVVSFNTIEGANTAIQGSSNADGCTILNNTIINPTRGILLASGSDNHFVIGNKIINASVDAIDDSGSGTQFLYNEGAAPIFDGSIKWMTNTSGAGLVAGDLVTLKAVAAGNEVTTTTNQGDDLVFGMAYETIASTEKGRIQTLGKTTAMKVDGTTDIAIGDFIGTFTTAKIGMKAAAGDMAIAIALEAYITDDSAGVIDALLIVPRKI